MKKVTQQGKNALARRRELAREKFFEEVERGTVSKHDVDGFTYGYVLGSLDAELSILRKEEAREI